jgi:thiol:disulfide interchange protein DsbG
MRGFILTIFLVTISMTANAAEPSLPAPLQKMKDDGAQVRYLGNDQGFDGWVMIQNAQEQYFYVTPDGQSIFMGILFNNKGDAVTLRQVAALRQKEPGLDKIAEPETTRAKPSSESATPVAQTAGQPSRSEQLFSAVQTTNAITLGDATAPAIYMFIDPQCPHCHDMIKDIRKSGFLEKKMLRVQVIPVGLMSPESLNQAAALLASPRAVDDLYAQMDGKAVTVPAGINTQSVQKNMSVMQDFKLDVTPFTVYRTADGQIKIIRGRASDLKSVVAQLK